MWYPPPMNAEGCILVAGRGTVRKMGVLERQNKMHRRRDIREVVMGVYEAIRERGGHDPVCQIAGYLLSGEPAYITGFRGARELIQSVERHEIVGELLRAYFVDSGEGPAEPGDTG